MPVNGSVQRGAVYLENLEQPENLSTFDSLTLQCQSSTSALTFTCQQSVLVSCGNYKEQQTAEIYKEH